MEINPENTQEVAAGVIIGVPSLWILFKKLMVRTAVETTNQGAAEAQSEIIELLRAEVRRAHDALEKSDVRQEKMTADIEALQEKLRVIKLRGNREEIYDHICKQEDQ